MGLGIVNDAMMVGDDLRILIAGLTLMSCCSALLGVLLGWKLRGREASRLVWKIGYLQEQLREAWTKNNRVVTRGGRGWGKTATEVSLAYYGDQPHVHIFSAMTGQCMYCSLKQCNAKHPNRPSMRCTKPPGHYNAEDNAASNHGYAGIFWE